MHPMRFDRLAKRVSVFTSRRTLLTLLPRVALAGQVLLEGDEAEARRGCKNGCGVCETC